MDMEGLRLRNQLLYEDGARFRIQPVGPYFRVTYVIPGDGILSRQVSNYLCRTLQGAFACCADSVALLTGSKVLQ
jgi:hypothetical protein